MPNDLTWNELNNNKVGFYQIDFEPDENPNVQGGRIVISIPISNASGMDSGGVVLFTYHLLSSCNRAQNVVNRDVPTGQRLASFPNPAIAAPTTGADNITRATNTQQLITRLRVSSDNAIGNVV